MEQVGPKKLLLINPANKARTGFLNEQGTRFMPLGLGIVAALTPAHWEVELLDESFEEFSLKPADLVAITSFTSTAPRAYEIAALYREAGIHTVMGGIHASMCPDEALAYFDTVVIREAEGAWPDLIADFEAGKTKRQYDGGINDVKIIPHVRRDIYKYPYTYDLVQTSRGCPFSCEFCSVSTMCGKTYRERDVEEVLDELEETTRPMLFFVDDNLVNIKEGSDQRAIKLFKGMVERGIKKYWVSQAAINFADNEEVLYWARKSGCTLILMGIEAETVQALKGVRKTLNLKRGIDSYGKLVKKIHKHGIGILATIIFGLENDTKEDLFARAEFIRKTAIDCYQCTVLTPLPGTEVFNRLKEQNRIILNNYPSDWQNYHFWHVTINTLNLNADELESNMRNVWIDLYNKVAMRRKMFRTLWNTKSFMTAYWAYASNHNYGRICLEGITPGYPKSGISGSAWDIVRSRFYLKFTDKIFWMMYLVAWTRIIGQLSSETPL